MVPVTGAGNLTINLSVTGRLFQPLARHATPTLLISVYVYMCVMEQHVPEREVVEEEREEERRTMTE